VLFALAQRTKDYALQWLAFWYKMQKKYRIISTITETTTALSSVVHAYANSAR